MKHHWCVLVYCCQPLVPISLFLPLTFVCSCSLRWRENLRDVALNPCTRSWRDCGFWTSNGLFCSAEVSSFFFSINFGIIFFLWCFFNLLHRRMNGRELEGMTSSDLLLLDTKILHALVGLRDQQLGPRRQQIAREQKEVKQWSDCYRFL